MNLEPAKEEWSVNDGRELECVHFSGLAGFGLLPCRRRGVGLLRLDHHSHAKATERLTFRNIAEWLMMSVFFPIAYACVFACLLVQIFQSIRNSAKAGLAARKDRTGLRTIHPELLDENGNVTDEELWSVRFADSKEGKWAPEAG